MGKWRAGGHVRTSEGLQPGTLHKPKAQDTAGEAAGHLGTATERHMWQDSRLHLGSEGTALCLHPPVLRHRPRVAMEHIRHGWCESSHFLISVTLIIEIATCGQGSSRATDNCALLENQRKPSI